MNVSVTYVLNVLISLIDIGALLFPLSHYTSGAVQARRGETGFETGPFKAHLH